MQQWSVGNCFANFPLFSSLNAVDGTHEITNVLQVQVARNGSFLTIVGKQPIQNELIRHERLDAKFFQKRFDSGAFLTSQERRLHHWQFAKKRREF